MNSKREQGKNNYDWGHEAEALAADMLMRKGYMIRERNWRMGHCEIDLILEKDRTIIFVEVKARKSTSIQDPLHTVDDRKRRLLIKAADVYLRNLPYLYQYRFDIVTLTGTRESYDMKHYEDAFMPMVNNGHSRTNSGW